jgi:hypothetical protein
MVVVRRLGKHEKRVAIVGARRVVGGLQRRELNEH